MTPHPIRPPHAPLQQRFCAHTVMCAPAMYACMHTYATSSTVKVGGGTIRSRPVGSATRIGSRNPVLRMYSTVSSVRAIEASVQHSKQANKQEQQTLAGEVEHLQAGKLAALDAGDHIIRGSCTVLSTESHSAAHASKPSVSSVDSLSMSSAKAPGLRARL